MKDIKITKQKVKKVVERESVVNHNEKTSIKTGKLSFVFFTSMFMAVFVYIFLVSSSIFYSVKESKLAYKSTILQNNLVNEDDLAYVSVKRASERISFINKSTDSGLSLK